MEGIVYKYVSPSNKVYIGQTTNEKERRKKFMGNNSYAGDKIDNARKKYGPENFKYEILETVHADDLTILSEELNRLETYYIGLYNSFETGYNMSIGGQGSVGYKLSEQQRQKITRRLLTNNPFKGKTHTQEVKDLISETNSKPVLQIDKNTGDIVNRFKSATEAAKYLGKKRGNVQISKVCKKYIQPSDGKRFLSAYGYKWEYDIEGSTTTETTLKDGKD